MKKVEKDRKIKRQYIQQKNINEELKKITQVNKARLIDRENAIVHKGRPLIFRAKKKRIKKRVSNKNKLSQADLDYHRYVGQTAEEDKNKMIKQNSGALVVAHSKLVSKNETSNLSN